jgi:hypothetical protein
LTAAFSPDILTGEMNANRSGFKQPPVRRMQSGPERFSPLEDVS